jgi:hypothetical protein
MVVNSSFRLWPISGGQDEVGKVFEHPVVFQGVIDDSQEFSRQGEIRLTPAAATLDTLIQRTVRAISIFRLSEGAASLW